MTKLLLPPTASHFRDGEHTDSNARRLAELLHEYDFTLSLEYIPEGEQQGRSLSAILKPYRVVRHSALGVEVVKWITGEEMKNPAAILAWIYEGDFKKHRPNDIINKIELRERTERMFNLKAQQEEAQERQDVLAWGLKGGRDGKHFLRYNKRVKVAR